MNPETTNNEVVEVVIPTEEVIVTEEVVAEEMAQAPVEEEAKTIPVAGSFVSDNTCTSCEG